MTKVRRVGSSDANNDSDITDEIFSLQLFSESTDDKFNVELDSHGKTRSSLFIDTTGIIGGDDVTCVTGSKIYFIISKFSF